MTDWKQKLVAYLHDPPHKPRAIAGHERQRQSFLNRLGLNPDALRDFDRSNDWQAAAADRLIFPDPAKSGLRVDWEENDFEFRHPLGGGILTPDRFPETAAGLEEAFVSALDGIAPETEDWKLKFIRSWRLWPERSAREKAAHLAYIVADTRIPDHTLWHHNALAAAFTATLGKPAFLIFQIGPVQDFIAQARKTQDLWSASYLLSFLIAQAMLAVADEIGPDAVIYPQLRGAPLADWHWWKEGYWGLAESQKLRASHSNELLTPNLPNRFLALVPGGQEGRALAHKAEAKVRETWNAIAASVHCFVGQQTEGEYLGWDAHWQAQVKRFPTADWIVHDWRETAEAISLAAKNSPPVSGGWTSHPLHHAYLWATEMIPEEHRERYAPNSNPGFAWALHYAAADWKFAARKNARSFAPWSQLGEPVADGVPKDHLDGRNEALGGAQHTAFRELLNDEAKFRGEFKGTQLYGALSVIKRLWPRCYLGGALQWEKWRPRFESTVEVAASVPVPKDVLELSEEIAAEGGSDEGARYFAILCMDGDDMGRWVSGSAAGPLVNSLAAEAGRYLGNHWRATEELPRATELQRPLSPGFHVALSESLANFSLYCAGPIVREFGGQLLYAGGDDVVAMLPAADALDCAHALQIAFRGALPGDENATKVRRVLESVFDYSHHVDGFLTLRRGEGRGVGRAENLKPNWPLMVMGPRATISAGIAIGHVHAPMQDTIQAARDAEREAKAIPRKGAFCLSILKRSGEAVSFTARWDSGVQAVWSELNSGRHTLSGRFAYRYAELVKALVVEGGSVEGPCYAEHWANPPHLTDAIEAELVHVLKQQGNLKHPEAQALAKSWRNCLIGDDRANPALSPRDFLHFWAAWAFLRRNAEPNNLLER